jgi:glyoxylase-like metal-dependent hydrolase (beta-lactamase superfamily II)
MALPASTAKVRAMFRHLCFTLLFALAACLAAPLQAAAPRAAIENPGFYRITLGDFEVIALSDGSHPFPVESVMIDTPHEAVAAALAGEDLGLPLQGSINAFLINTGARLVLIDTGAGALYGACCGRLLANLRTAGYQPEQVDEILLTHLHKDHVGGVLAGGKIAFPNAVLRVARADADYWRDAASRARAPAFLHSFFDSAAESLAPYAAAGRLRPFDGDGELLPGIRSVSEPGHTPGHTAYLVESRGQRLLVWGDIVHVAPVQLKDPQASLKYDSSAAAARRTRRGLLERAAREHLWIGAAHISFPGLGHIRRDGAGYRWVPANYESLPAGQPAD